MNLLFLLSISALTLGFASAALQTSTLKLYSCEFTIYKNVMYRQDNLTNQYRQANSFEDCAAKCLQFPGCKAVTYALAIGMKFCAFHGSGLPNANPDKSLYIERPNFLHAVVNCSNEGTTQGPTQGGVGCGIQADGYKPVITKNTRIIGGSEAKPHSWPWLCGMAMNNFFRTGICGCSLLRVKDGVEMSDIILTAAHCVVESNGTATNPKPGEIYVDLGDHNKAQFEDGEESRKATKIAAHPDYRFTTTIGAVNDLALVKLATPVKFTDTIRPICLPQAGEAIPTGKTCVAAGWGRNNSYTNDLPTNLQQVLAPAQDARTCTAGWRSIYNEAIHICAGNTAGTTGTCQGDSGGMLSCQQPDGSWRLYGVTSFGIAGTCLQAGRPSVFTRLSNYVDWINKNMNEMTSFK